MQTFIKKLFSNSSSPVSQPRTGYRTLCTPERPLGFVPRSDHRYSLLARRSATQS